MSKENFHEHFERPELPLPSERSTGLVFVAVALIVAYIWRGSPTVLTIALSIAVVLAMISLARPILLRPLNVAWMKFAALLAQVMNPIVMLLLFAVVIVPAGLLMQLCYDPLNRRKTGSATYWVTRKADATASMANQF